MIRDYRARQKGRAQYLVAGQVAAHIVPTKPASEFRDETPAGLASPADLDFLDATNPFFHTDRALFSFGQFIRSSSTPHGIFRKRPGVTILGDSGGFQFIGAPDLYDADETPEQALAWLEANTDEAMTLDIPTMAIGEDMPWRTFDDALAVTLANNRYFHDHAAGRTRFLSVLQGRNRDEAIRWFNAVTREPFDGGWAFGGAMRLDIIHVADMLLRLHADGKLGPRNRVHVLGTSQLLQGVMLSALQKGIAMLDGEQDFQITFDTANPSLMPKYGMIYGYPKIDRHGDFAHSWYRPPDRPDIDAVKHRWMPVTSSRISEVISIADLSANPSIAASSSWDRLALAMLVNHNLDSMLNAFDVANSILELPSKYARELAPLDVVKAYNEIIRAFDKYRHNPLQHLRTERAVFERLKLVGEVEE